jgi:hypothetical protein
MTFHHHHVNYQATFYAYNLHLSVSLKVIVASIYVTFYIKVGVGTFLTTPTPQPWLEQYCFLINLQAEVKYSELAVTSCSRSHVMVGKR